MGSCSENILKQSFGGVYSNELLAEGGRLYSERPEPFSYISVEVCARVCLVFGLDLVARGRRNCDRFSSSSGSST